MCIFASENERGIIMCTCIAEIKTSYTKVRKQTAGVVRQYFDADEYLDQINVVKRELVMVINETNALVELVRSHFTEFDAQESEELLSCSAPILILMNHLYEKLIGSSLYPGLKTTVEEYCNSMSAFQELCNDIQVWNIDLPRDKEFQESCERLNHIA